MIAFILACAGIVEPSAGASAAVAVFAFVAFYLYLSSSHCVWKSGYEQAKMEMTFTRSEGRESQAAEWHKAAAEKDWAYRRPIDD